MSYTIYKTWLYCFCVMALCVSVLITVWYYQLMRFIRWQPNDKYLESLARTKVTVIIPARNEEEDIAVCLESVLAQELVDIQVLLVNDHSSDATPKIADAYARGDSRVRVIHDPVLRPGWLGKVNAMHEAFEQANSELVIFSDADVLHAPNCFASLISRMEDEQLAFASLMPRIICVALFENVNVPAYLGGFCQIANDMLRPNSDRAFGAGACMVVHRNALIDAGGLAKIKHEMLDDVALATLIRRSGLRVGFWAGGDLVRVRLFKGNCHAFWGMTKNVLAEIGKRMWMSPIAIAIPFIVFWTPPICVGLGIAWNDWLLVATGAATYAAQYFLMVIPGREFIDFRPVKVLCFPLVSVVLLCCFLRASYHFFVRGAVFWRGRSIPVRLKS